MSGRLVLVGTHELRCAGSFTFGKRLETDNVHSHDALFEEYFGPFEDTLACKACVAAAAQQMLNVATAHQVAHLEKRTDLDRLLFEGGVALNCLNNTPLFEGSRFEDMQVSFGASDTGITIGAAAHAWLNHPDTDPASIAAAPVTPYLGPSYDEAAIEEALEGFAGRVAVTRPDDDEVVRRVAELLTEKVVIGWFEGRIEHGPRALGHHRIPGAVHVDGTSRIQTLTDEGTPRLTALLRKFTELTGVPCLINTSFNVAGEPIVRTPTDALNCLLGTEIDYLILGNHLITKTDPVT